MKHIKHTITLPILLFFGTTQAQIYINTGNPNLDKYKQQNPNAVIWEKGKTIPMPANTPNDPSSTQKTVTAPAATKTVAPKIEETPKPAEKAVAVVPKAAENPTDYPPNAEAGKCYARCIAPDQFEYKEDQVIDKPAAKKVEKIAAVYETVYDTIIVKPATKKTVTTPATYETVTDQVLVSPAKQEWVKGKADINCLSQNPKDCEVLCLKDIPAVYKTITKKVEKTPSVTTELEVPAVTKVLPRKKLIQPAAENVIDIPATYKTVMKKVLVAKGGYQEWREVLCQQDITSDKVKNIQLALIREGYDPGPADNVMGSKTKDALLKFQNDKGLPTGNLNIETLNSLGVK
jgi:hypothetical protein